MERAIIYGAGNTGKWAYEWLKKQYDIMFFVDKDTNKWGETIDEKIVHSPEILLHHRNTKIIIASLYSAEILNEIQAYGLKNVSVFKTEVISQLSKDITEQLDDRTIDLGLFFQGKQISCKELTFISGGSLITDYMFIKHVAELIQCKEYLEIGTYIGESINILTDICEKLYSITAPLDAPFSMRNWCKLRGKTDFSDRLAQNPKIQHFYVDSKQFDFSGISGDIDLFYIDASHQYDAVFSDTKNVFSIKKKDAIVIWHDFREPIGYRSDVVRAVSDVLGEDFENVYVTNNNMCGIYLPDKYKKYFPIYKRIEGQTEPLYVYDTQISNKSVY